MFKDHVVLDLQLLSHTGFAGALVHRNRDRDIDVGQTNGVEVDPFTGVFTSRFSTRDQIHQVAVDVVVGQFAVFVHAAKRLRPMLDRFPVIANDLVANLGNGVFIFPAADVAVERAGFHPVGFQQRRLGAGGGDDDVGITGRLLQITASLLKLHSGKIAAISWTN